MKAATVRDSCIWDMSLISIHAAREGGDSFVQRFKFAVSISIHAAREGGDIHALWRWKLDLISIHAAREGGDAVWSVIMLVLAHISIHAAREGGDK